jgi:hypothetical protein
MATKVRINGTEVSPESLDSNMQPVRKRPITVHAMELLYPAEVETLEGTMTGNPGDFLMRGVQGEHYVCRRDIFLSSHEQAPLTVLRGSTVP